MFLRRIHRIPRFGGIQVRNGKRRNVHRSFFFPLHFSHYAATLYYYDPQPPSHSLCMHYSLETRIPCHWPKVSKISLHSHVLVNAIEEKSSSISRSSLSNIPGSLPRSGNCWKPINEELSVELSLPTIQSVKINRVWSTYHEGSGVALNNKRNCKITRQRDNKRQLVASLIRELFG